ncbi:MAG: hypothetical protein JXR13_00995 [Thalassovita sp.]
MPPIDSIGLANTAVPLGVLAVLVLVLPHYMVDGATRSHATVLRGIGGVACMTLAAGFVMSMVVTQIRGYNVLAQLQADPLTGAMIHGRLAALSALVWGPILALVWFSKAQGVEARRGQDVAGEGLGQNQTNSKEDETR